LENKLKRKENENSLIIKNEFNKIINHFNKREFKESLQLAIKIDKKYPDSYKIKNILGAAYTFIEDFEKAKHQYILAIKLNPIYAEAYNNLASTFQSLGDYKKAIKNYLEAIENNSEFYDALRNLGEIYILTKQFNLAEESFEKAEQIRPLSAEIYNKLGNNFFRIGKYDKAEKNYKKSFKVEPKNPEPLYNLGILSEKLNKLKKSSNYYIKAIKLKPDFYQAINNYGNILNKIGKTKESLFYFKKAILLNPKFPEAHNNLGNSYNNLGKFEEAEKFFNNAIELSPKYFEAYRNLSLVKEFKKKDPLFEIMIEMLKEKLISDDDKIQLNFALGKAFEDIEDYKNSFFYLLEGNRLRKKELNYNIEGDKKLFTNIEKSFFNNKVNLNLVNKDYSKIPIFVIGMPRSGTSLVEQILSSHPEIEAAGELEFLNLNIKKLKWSLKGLTRKNFKQIREGYFNGVNDLQFKKKFFVDKMPLNFRWIGFIKKSIPEAKIIHLSRDSRAVCWSLFKHYFSSIGNGYAYDLKDAVDYFNLYTNLMDFYKEQYPDFIYEVNYENLTINQKDETSKMLNYIGLRWDEKCLKFYEGDRSIMTASSVQVRKKIYQGSSEKWKNYSSHLNNVFNKLQIP
jgi:tetratricopeptide (TPR) repeat protein|tara:strand:+ start:2554 stop:4428 length:1875 start_codon:yes stop_codon:yes gene_type:complete